MPPDNHHPRVATVECVLPAGDDLDATMRFFVDELGFRLDAVTPADNPALVRLSGHGMRLALDRAQAGGPGTLRLTTPDNVSRAPRVAPNGARIEFVPADPPLSVPEPCVEAALHPFDDAGWTRGRAGMRYRDLIPNRLGGYLIASHIRIPEGGPVPDQVHHHSVRFQFIYCHRGWVELVYEDQGDPFVLRDGDCVLQPPHIRHRVLAASGGLEVVELACPATHMTHIDHTMTLPTGRHLPERDYGGQSFTVHHAERATWERLSDDGLEARDLGLEGATDGRVQARVLRRNPNADESDECEIRGRGAFVFLFVLQGSASASIDAVAETGLGPGGTCILPGHSRARLRCCSPELEMLEVSCPD